MSSGTNEHVDRPTIDGSSDVEGELLLYRRLGEQLALASYVADTAEVRSVLYASPRMESMLGYSARELVDDSTLFGHLVHPADRGRVREALVAALEAEGSADIEYRLVGRDGRVVWVRDEAVRERSAGRDVVHGFLRDVTEERLAGEAHRESQTRMRLLAEQLPAVVWTTDEELSLTSLLGRGLAGLALGPDDFPGTATVDQHRRALAGEHVAFEAEWGGRPFEAHVEPLQDIPGQRIGVIGIAVDVTERRRAEAQLRTSEEQLHQGQRMEALGRLAGGVAHDFNNLLTSIMGNAHLLAETLGPEDPAREEVESIKRVSQRGAALIEQLLAFSRRQVLEPKVLDLNAVVSGMEQMLRRLLPDDVRLVTSLDPGLHHVRIDPARLEQVIMNLVVNARDAMPTGGSVLVETYNLAADSEGDPSRREPHVALIVADTGQGIDEGTKSRIFEPFFTTKVPGEGTGLGLATVLGIVEQSGGEISVEGEPEKGARFRVTFPSTDAPIEAPVAEVRGPVPAGGRETVLLVEDDDEVRAFARRALERSGYTVLEASRGDEALETWRRLGQLVDLLLTDVVLPGLDGVALNRELERIGANLPVLFISGFVGDDRREAELADFDAPLLRKPFTPDQLTHEVRAVLDRWPRQASDRH
jgi:PAS domain S-box-containing protein